MTVSRERGKGETERKEDLSAQKQYFEMEAYWVLKPVEGALREDRYSASTTGNSD